MKLTLFYKISDTLFVRCLELSLPGTPPTPAVGKPVFVRFTGQPENLISLDGMVDDRTDLLIGPETQSYAVKLNFTVDENASDTAFLGKFWLQAQRSNVLGVLSEMEGQILGQ